MRFRVNGRCPTVVNIMLRGTETFTGRPSFFDAMAAIQECGHGNNLQPKPEPIKREITCTDSRCRLSTSAATLRWFTTPCEVSYSVNLSLLQFAMVACISMGLCVSTGVS